MRASIILTLALGAVAASAKTIFPRAYPSECLIDKYLLVFLLMSLRFATECALDCLSKANFHGCGTTDYSCLCTNHQFLDETSQCIYNECTNPQDLTQAIQAAGDACKAAVCIIYLLFELVNQADLLPCASVSRVIQSLPHTPQLRAGQTQLALRECLFA